MTTRELQQYDLSVETAAEKMRIQALVHGSHTISVILHEEVY